MEKGSLLTIGDNVVDKYEDRSLMFPGGQCVNVAVCAHLCGLCTAHMGVVGTDEGGQLILRTLARHEIRTGRCRREEGENAYVVVTHRNGERVFLGGNRLGVSFTHPLRLTQEDLAYIDGFSLVYTNWNSLMDETVPVLKARGVRVVYDYSVFLTPERVSRTAPYIFMGAFSGSGPDAEISEKTVRSLLQAGAVLVLKTLGEKGQVLYWQPHPGQVHTLKNPAVPADKVVDTNGAGDAYLGAFLASLLSPGEGEVPEKPGHDHPDRTFPELTEKRLVQAMQKASSFAAQMIGVEGAFGEGVPLSGKLQTLITPSREKDSPSGF